MGGYILYEEFNSPEFWVSTTVLIIITIPEVVFFCITHYYAIIFNERHNLMESVRAVNFETMLYFGFNLVAGIPVGVSIIMYDPDSSLRLCNILYAFGVAYIYLSNFFLYRLLIAKSTLYDPMSQMSRLSRVTWWVIHIFYLPLLLYVISSTVIWSREFVDVNGKASHCVETHSKTAPSLFAAIDLTISLACILILAAPAILSPATKEIREVVIRNCTVMFIAASSTLLLLIYAVTASNGQKSREGFDFFIVKTIVRLGALDVGINLTMICLSWPLSFYWTIVAKAVSRAITPFISENKSGFRSDRSENKSGNQALQMSDIFEKRESKFVSKRLRSSAMDINEVKIETNKHSRRIFQGKTRSNMSGGEKLET